VLPDPGLRTGRAGIRRLFLFTAGDEHGSIQGQPMDGVPFRYWSFSVDGYRELLRENGLSLVDTHRDKGQNIYYLARTGDGAA
jgi:hypothetical protein